MQSQEEGAGEAAQEAAEAAADTANRTIEESGRVIATVRDTFEEWLGQAIDLLPNFIVAVAVVLLFALLAKIARAMVSRVLRRVTASEAIVRLVGTIASLAVTAIGIFVALEVLHLEKAVTSLLAGAGVVGLALAFAFQDLAANLVAGVYMSVKQPAAVGDVVETNDAFGKVTDIDLRNTTLRTPDGEFVIIPNRKIFENKLVNYSRSGEHRVKVECGVSYGDDLEKARRVAIDAVSEVSSRDPAKGVEFYYTEFGGSSVNFMLRFWVSYSSNSDLHAARHEAMVRLKTALDDAGLTIPFPIRTLDFGIVGGEHLRDAWPE